LDPDIRIAGKATTDRRAGAADSGEAAPGGLPLLGA